MLETGSTPTETAQLKPAAGARPISRLVAFRPPVGPPDDVNAELSKQLNEAAIEQGIALVADVNMKPDLMLRGYVSALRKGSAVNLSYLWDVLDSRGQRVTRFEGEEALSGNIDIKQPWTAMTPAVSRSIAQRSMSDLAKWLKASAPPPTTVSSVQGMPPSGLSGGLGGEAPSLSAAPR